MQCLAASHLPEPLEPHSKFAVISCQRSGTQILRDVLNSNSHIGLLAEPFSRYHRSVYWHNYVHTLSEELYPPQYATDAMLLLDQYMDKIREEFRENKDKEGCGGSKPDLRTVGLDVKYNQLKGISPEIIDLRAQPLLLDYFRSRS